MPAPGAGPDGAKIDDNAGNNPPVPGLTKIATDHDQVELAHGEPNEKGADEDAQEDLPTPLQEPDDSAARRLST